MTQESGKRNIRLKNQNVEYFRRISPRSRSVRITISLEGDMSVSASPSVNENRIEKFLAEKADWILRAIAKVKNRNVVVIKAPKGGLIRYGKETRALVLTRIAYFNSFHRFIYKNICIKNQKSRWGSCSKKGNLNFNYKIIFLPTHLSDYIIVHELCHLKELNHSPRFWSLVETILPDYRSLRSELYKTHIRFVRPLLKPGIFDFSGLSL